MHICFGVENVQDTEYQCVYVRVCTVHCNIVLLMLGGQAIPCNHVYLCNTKKEYALIANTSCFKLQAAYVWLAT